MATDATGTPTSPDSIPKYNTSADAPSGNGFNAAMDQLQVALSARVSKPVGIVTGEVPVWNGASWDRSTTTRVGTTSLGTGTPDATKFLRGDGSWQVAGLKTTVSTLASGPPASPADTDIWIATSVDGTNGVRWTFQYNSAATTYKWEYLGGSPVHRLNGSTTQNTLDSTWQYIAGQPSFTLARAGQYRYRIGGNFSGNNANFTYMTVGTTGAGNLQSEYIQVGVGSSLGGNLTMNMATTQNDVTASITRSAGEVLGLCQQCTAHTNTSWTASYMEVEPIHVI